ncbi:MAG: TolC family protein [Deltaproteobacteria bacterium]|jgi:outer membrane protein|nr:TolC family protein [Deltaproteobacteria bacterium]
MKNKIYADSLIILVLFFTFSFFVFSKNNAYSFYLKPVKAITLNEAYILAARRNDTIKAAKESYYQSTLLKWSAIGMVLPDISLKYTDQRMHVNSAPSSLSASGAISDIFPFFFPNYKYSFTLNEPIFNIGAIPAYMSAINTEKATEMSVNNVSANTLYNVAVNYYTVLNDLSLIKADAKTFNEAKSHLELTEAKLKAGLAIITDLLQAKAQFYAAKQELISSKNSLKAAKANLAALLGISRHFGVIKPSKPVFKKVLLKRYVILAYKNNPNIKSLKFAQKSANDKTGYYESQYIPKIDFSASYNALSNEHFIPQGSTNYWTAGATLTMPLFQGASRIISIEKARSEANMSMYNTAQAKRDLKASVISEFYNVRSLKYEVNTLRHEERFASKNYMLVEEEFKAGVATSVDVVTALAELTKARHNLLSAKLNYYESVLDLKRLIGSFNRKLISLTVGKFN